MKIIIITGIILILIGGALWGAAYALGGESMKENFSETYNGDFTVLNVEKIEIGDHVGEIRVFKNVENTEKIIVTAENIKASNFNCSVTDNKTLKIKYNPGFLSFIFKPFWSANSVINIYIPEGKLFDEVNFKSGVGKTVIDAINAKSFMIDGGVGSFDIKNIYAENLNIKGGVGEIKVSGEIKGNIKIDGGVGEVKLDLKGDRNDYNINVKGGVGETKLNGKKISGNDNINNSKYSIKIDGGVGSININIK